MSSLSKTPALIGLISSAAFTLSVAAEDPASPEPNRDYHLFVGADILARSDGAFIPVRNVKGQRVLVDDPRPEYRPIRKMEGMSLKLSPKVSAVSAQIETFEADTIFVPTMEHIVDQAQIDLFIQNQTAMAESQQFQAETQILRSDDESVGDAFSVVGGGGAGGAEQQLGEATDALENLANMEEASEWEEGLVIGTDRDTGNAVKLSFMLSSDVAIADAYVVAMVRIWAEERFFDLTLFNHVGPVDGAPRRVTLVQRNLPTGLEIKESEIYLFSRGEEIPTNLSPKHIKITQAEAREFVKLSHFSDHRIGDIPARPVWALAPKKLLAASDASRFRHPVQVDLDADGSVLSIKGPGKANIPAEVEALINEMTFLPALQNGSPVASSLTMNPADFFADNR